MQPSPAFTIEIQRFIAWRVAVVGLAVLALVALSAWAIAAKGNPFVLVLSAVLALGVAVATVTLMRSAVPVRLLWDGRDWTLTRGGPPAVGSGHTGRLAAMLDLGTWLLLRWVENSAGVHRRHAWIPVGRRGLEAQWHSLRCAVYCARPSHDGSADSAR